MKISTAGLAAIKRHEGLRLHAYLDSAGVLTIGYGSTSNVQPGLHITELEAEQRLRADLETAETAVNNGVRVPITQEQFDACVSLTFNIGASAFLKSTLLQKLNAGEFAEAANEFLRWDKITVNGEKEVLPGLTSRRRAERAMFLATTTPSAQEKPATAPQTPAGDPAQYSQEAGMPIPALVTALLPSVVSAIPALAKIFKPGSEVAQRNVAAASAVMDIVQQATGAVNAQAAVEALADPVKLQAATKAVESRWFELAETGGGIEGARKADTEFRATGDPVWKSPSFIVALALLPLVYMVVGSVVGLFGAPFSEDVRAAIANGIVGLILGGLIGYYYGQSTSRNRTPAQG